MGNIRCGTATPQALLCPMFIQGVGTAAPDQDYTQAQCWEAVSSSSVFFVLESALRDSVPDGHWWLSSFGAGFSCHGAFLQVGSAP